MRIGIDFDNTIADYTGVFHRVALDLQWISSSIGQSKTEVKQHFFDNNLGDRWTALQGIVYGKEIHRAIPYVDCIDTLNVLNKLGHELFIVSHKTKYPIIYKCEENNVNFHDAAYKWLKDKMIIGGIDSPIKEKNVFFNETKEKKLHKIVELKCDVFIDDLLEIILHDLLSENINRIYFSSSETGISNRYKLMARWSEFCKLI